MKHLESIWNEFNLPDELLNQITLSGRPGLASSFHVSQAAQTSIGLAAGAAELLYEVRSGERQSVHVSQRAAELECSGYFELDGKFPGAWEKFSGLYPTKDGHVRIHANFDHHRDGVLELLELGDAATTSKKEVATALQSWSAEAFESAAAERGLVVAKARTFAEWDTHAHALWMQDAPLIRVTQTIAGPVHDLSRIRPDLRPLSGVKVLDLTRILAGPMCGRTLAGYGADVMLINSPHLPNIAHIVDTSRGKRSAHLDLGEKSDRAVLEELVREADVFVQGYRPGALANLGLSPKRLNEINPTLVSVSLSAYGHSGPWGGRRGFDSIVQTAAGFNRAEAEAAGSDEPKPMPVQILDYASGFLMAFGAQLGLYRRMTQGGSWHVEVSLLQTAHWLRDMGRRKDGFDVPKFEYRDAIQRYPCAEGELKGMPHGAEFERTPVTWQRRSASPGTDAPLW